MHEGYHGTATAGQPGPSAAAMGGPETWAEREQEADIDYENSDTYSGRYPRAD